MLPWGPFGSGARPGMTGQLHRNMNEKNGSSPRSSRYHHGNYTVESSSSLKTDEVLEKPPKKETSPRDDKMSYKPGESMTTTTAPETPAAPVTPGLNKSGDLSQTSSQYATPAETFTAQESPLAHTSAGPSQKKIDWADDVSETSVVAEKEDPAASKVETVSEVRATPEVVKAPVAVESPSLVNVSALKVTGLTAAESTGEAMWPEYAVGEEEMPRGETLEKVSKEESKHQDPISAEKETKVTKRSYGKGSRKEATLKPSPAQSTGLLPQVALPKKNQPKPSNVAASTESNGQTSKLESTKTVIPSPQQPSSGKGKERKSLAAHSSSWRSSKNRKEEQKASAVETSTAQNQNHEEKASGSSSAQKENVSSNTTSPKEVRARAPFEKPPMEVRQEPVIGRFRKNKDKAPSKSKPKSLDISKEEKTDTGAHKDQNAFGVLPVEATSSRSSHLHMDGTMETTLPSTEPIPVVTKEPANHASTSLEDSKPLPKVEIVDLTSADAAPEREKESQKKSAQSVDGPSEETDINFPSKSYAAASAVETKGKMKSSHVVSADVVAKPEISSTPSSPSLDRIPTPTSDQTENEEPQSSASRQNRPARRLLTGKSPVGSNSPSTSATLQAASVPLTVQEAMTLETPSITVGRGESRSPTLLEEPLSEKLGPATAPESSSSSKSQKKTKSKAKKKSAKQKASAQAQANAPDADSASISGEEQYPDPKDFVLGHAHGGPDDVVYGDSGKFTKGDRRLLRKVHKEDYSFPNESDLAAITPKDPIHPPQVLPIVEERSESDGQKLAPFDPYQGDVMSALDSYYKHKDRYYTKLRDASINADIEREKEAKNQEAAEKMATAETSPSTREQEHVNADQGESSRAGESKTSGERKEEVADLEGKVPALRALRRFHGENEPEDPKTDRAKAFPKRVIKMVDDIPSEPETEDSKPSGPKHSPTEKRSDETRGEGQGEIKINQNEWPVAVRVVSKGSNQKSRRRSGESSGSEKSGNGGKGSQRDKKGKNVDSGSGSHPVAASGSGQGSREEQKSA